MEKQISFLQLCTEVLIGICMFQQVKDILNFIIQIYQNMNPHGKEHQEKEEIFKEHMLLLI